MKLSVTLLYYWIQTWNQNPTMKREISLPGVTFVFNVFDELWHFLFYRHKCE